MFSHIFWIKGIFLIILHSMTTIEWTYIIGKSMPYSPTEGQAAAMTRLGQFMESVDMSRTTDDGRRSVMVLRGSAGTGKTTLARAFVHAVSSTRYKVVLLAPTGRAAKVFSSGSGRTAFTIHRKIYRQQSYLSERFVLNDNLHKDTLFIVDEASMINATMQGGAETFGSGNLLDDLIRYVFSGRHCSLVLVGDTAQLPPVGCDNAPALLSSYLSGYGMEVFDYDLLEVMRQSQGSGILTNAVALRSLLLNDTISGLPKMRFSGFADISVCHGSDLIEQLAYSYSHAGTDETIVITRSNKRANIYNMGIRNQVLGCEEELSANDQIMIVKNNYYWTEHSSSSNILTQKGFHSHMLSQQDSSSDTPAFLANGDRGVIRRVRNHRSLYGFHFADALIEFPDYDGYELTATLLLDTLHGEAPALTSEEHSALFSAVMEDYADIPTKAERYKRLRNDVYFNALQIKYAYAVTCHKAQGGQWEHVYVDQGYITEDMLSPSYIHWLYTAFTRATKHLYLVNWPKEQVCGED